MVFAIIASDRTFGARRVWCDLLADGIACGLHRIERLMGLQALRARRLPRPLYVDAGQCWDAAISASFIL
jgi:putative transposase